MPSSEHIDIVSATMQRITGRGFDPKTASWDHRVCIFVHAAQGIIDNGGFEYFFEMPFPGNPELGEFVEAFNAIGAAESSGALAAAIKRHTAGTGTFDDLNSILWRNSESTWARLSDYIAAHPASYA
jgi:hypothetical protein